MRAPRSIALAVLIAFQGATPSAAAPGDLLQAILNPEARESNDRFGYSVAALGANIIVGVPNGPAAGQPSLGCVYLFDGATGAIILTIPDPVLATNQHFGESVASAAGKIVVGAWGTSDGTGSENGVAYVFDGGSGALLLTLHNPTPATGDRFGFAVAGVGGNVLVGAPLDDAVLSNDGSAYLFDGTLLGNTSTPLLTVAGPAPSVADRFGYSVAAAGTNLLIGAIGKDVSATDSGAAYLFDGTLLGTTSTPLLTINTPNPRGGGYFGWSVATLGGNLIIGALAENGSVNSDGRAYLFDGTLLGTTSTPLLSMTDPAPVDYDGFGAAVSSAGGHIVVGTLGWDGGSAYLFDATQTGTTNVPLLAMGNPTPATNDAFGSAVCGLGANVVVGANLDDAGARDTGAVYAFDGTATGTTSTPLLTILNPAPDLTPDRFGFDVAAVGGNPVVGSPGSELGSAAGAVYLFDGSVIGTNTTPLRIFDNPSPGNGDEFGYSVASIGGNVIVGSPYDDTGATNAGAAFLMSTATGAALWSFFNPAPALFDQYGYTVSGATINGVDYVLAGTPYDDGGGTNSGRVYRDSTLTGSVFTIFNPTPANFDLFGVAVADAGSNRILIGATGDDSGGGEAGSAYLVDGDTGALLLTINNPTPAASDWFGGSVAVVGGNLVVGAPYDDTGATDAGSVYIFDGSLTGTTSTPLLTINNPTPDASDNFGNDVAAVGSNVLIGARRDDTGATDAGSVYLFDGTLTGTTSTPLLTINNPTPAASDFFGLSVAAAGSNLLVGAFQDDTAGTDAGAAYLFCGMTGACATVVNPKEASPAGNLMATKGSGTSVAVTYTPACGATSHTAYWGTSPIAGKLAWTDAACGLTPATASFDPGMPPAGQVRYFVVVGQTATAEGSYGRDTLGQERPEAIAVGACDAPLRLFVICP